MGNVLMRYFMLQGLNGDLLNAELQYGTETRYDTMGGTLL